jgi:hypothetical protein
VPCCEGGYKAAVSDPDAIRALFSRYRNASIAVATGAINDLDVLDIDPRHGGNKFFEENRYRWPVTRVHQTPGGGQHFLFRHAKGLRCSDGRIAPGVDVKADGGGVVWHPTRFYPVHNAPVVGWPEWLLAMAREGKGASQTNGKSPADVWAAPSPSGVQLSGVQPTRNLRMRTGHILSVLQNARPDDGRNAKLYWAARRFGELIAAGSVTREIAEFMLLSAAQYNGHVAKRGLDQTVATIRSGLDHQIEEIAG